MEFVCIFAASSATLAQKYIDSAFEFGKELAKRGLGLVFGGGRTGLMGACARGVKAENGYVVGVIPKKLNMPGIAFEHCDELIVTEDMHTRKAAMEKRSSYFAALPGGVGTLEELAEALTLNQLGYIDAPIVVFNQDGFYDSLMAQLKRFTDEGFMNKAYLALFDVAATPKETADKLVNFKKGTLPDKLREAVENHEKIGKD